MSAIKTTPVEFLKKVMGNQVVVKLSSGNEYRGILTTLDGYMNLTLEQTCEYESNRLKSKFGDAFVRGNNVMYISTCENK
ncbi:U4/U6-U5 snRNP complex subunit lsm6 [Bonamia ostreae]|uniref:U4/U6-U5 snRNP complex subunit lsm6 n=1 Tax=Bonamia ostreae TaxID=126728 RepID=A0ABV2AFH2_9EUKA